MSSTEDAATFYEKLQKYLLTENQLQENNFARPVAGQPGQARVRDRYGGGGDIHNGRRKCFRCEESFPVDAAGKQLSTFATSCVFHDAGSPKGLHKCCGQPRGSPGCTRRDQHVARSTAPSSGYVRTKPSTSENATADRAVFALDCEMVYTTRGLDVCSVVVLDHAGHLVYTTMVKPEAEILDHNTRYSGVKEGDLDGVTNRLADVQTWIVLNFTNKTILVGHSLDSDLVGLQVIHSRVVDTGIAFPHPRPPFRHSLQSLVKIHLGRTMPGHDSILVRRLGRPAGSVLSHRILEAEASGDGGRGHDPEEDAKACLDLMRAKVAGRTKW